MVYSITHWSPSEISHNGCISHGRAACEVWRLESCLAERGRGHGGFDHSGVLAEGSAASGAHRWDVDADASMVEPTMGIWLPGQTNHGYQELVGKQYQHESKTGQSWGAVKHFGSGEHLKGWFSRSAGSGFLTQDHVGKGRWTSV